MSDHSSNSKKQIPKDKIESLKKHMIFGEPSSPSRHPTRFQKGKSGNPRGRPRKTAAIVPEPVQLNQLTLEEAERPIRVRDGEKVTEIPVKQALLQAQTAAALKGNPYAQRFSLDSIERAQREQAAQIARDQEYWSDYREDGLRQLAEAKANGEPEPDLIPYPLDIVIEPGKPVLVVGPINEAQARDYERLVKIRDALILQSAVNRRCSPAGKEAEGEARAEGSEFMMYMVDSMLPKRMRLDKSEWVFRIMRFEDITKRVLLKATFAAWRAADVPLRRGALAPSPALANALKAALKTLARQNQ